MRPYIPFYWDVMTGMPPKFQSQKDRLLRWVKFAILMLIMVGQVSILHPLLLFARGCVGIYIGSAVGKRDGDCP